MSTTTKSSERPGAAGNPPSHSVVSVHASDFAVNGVTTHTEFCDCGASRRFFSRHGAITFTERWMRDGKEQASCGGCDHERHVSQIKPCFDEHGFALPDLSVEVCEGCDMTRLLIRARPATDWTSDGPFGRDGNFQPEFGLDAVPTEIADRMDRDDDDDDGGAMERASEHFADCHAAGCDPFEAEEAACTGPRCPVCGDPRCYAHSETDIAHFENASG